MPTYDYKCVRCGHVFEVFHGMNEIPQIKCPICGAVAEKMIGAGAGLIFKGSGFYVTDYKHNSNNGNNRKCKNVKREEKEKKNT
ncbi:zinc ribbon domain-containing protein [candidate division KSB1 bacterium]|nr:MAG: zinc ribbon domain-containing protein [candidate division KSB1 bacterium]